MNLHAEESKKVIDLDSVVEVKIIRPFKNGQLAIPRKFVDHFEEGNGLFKAHLTDVGIWVVPNVDEQEEGSEFKDTLRDILEDCLTATHSVGEAVDMFVQKVEVRNRDIIIDNCNEPFVIESDLSELNGLYPNH